MSQDNPNSSNPHGDTPGNPHGGNPGNPDRPEPRPADRRPDVPVGTVVMYAGILDAHTAPTLAQDGWLPCDGKSLSVKEYRDLYDAIGTSHGGDGITFRVPDLRGTFVRGVDGGAGRDPDAHTRTAAASGGNAGDRVGSAQGHEFARHDHPAPHLPSTLHWAVDEAHRYDVAQWNGAETTTGTAGGSETRPRNVALHFIIRFRQG
jgi:hypothetical protein